MSLETPLPKSVKVRSTCNACQQAKIRCSHEKPACRRCQKHNMDCVYSMSRRLGRPAKKRDGEQRPKKERRVQKQAKAAKRNGSENEDQKSETKGFEGEVASIEDGLQTPLLVERSFSGMYSVSGDIQRLIAQII